MTCGMGNKDGCGKSFAQKPHGTRKDELAWGREAHCGEGQGHPGGGWAAPVFSFCGVSFTRRQHGWSMVEVNVCTDIHTCSVEAVRSVLLVPQLGTQVRRQWLPDCQIVDKEKEMIVPRYRRIEAEDGTSTTHKQHSNHKGIGILAFDGSSHPVSLPVLPLH